MMYRALFAGLLVAQSANAQVVDRLFVATFDQPAECPVGRQLSGVVVYPDRNGTTSRDYTSFAQLWGHNSAYDAETPWPGAQPSTPIPTIVRGQYIAAKFTVPANASSTLGGFIQRTTYSYGVSMTAAYSTSCGDLSPPNPSCISVTTGTPLPFPYWSLGSASNACLLTPGTTYYLNIKPTYPDEDTPTCRASSVHCPMGTTNYVRS